tara:strand:- start:4617 stop:7922 length:3306 start_codon:yes stop_codon:yes gene_type:complete
MTRSKYIAGAGGGGGKGGGGGSSPTEADDSLQSKQFANALDLISEGEIEGLDDGNKSIFFDGTPLQAADGSYNFADYTVVTRTGTQGQNYIPGVFSNIESETSVGVEVTNAAPVIRQITDDDVDRVRVTIQIPSLQKIEDDGDIVGTSVSISIQVQYNGGGYNTVKTDTISGKSSGSYQRDYLLTLTGSFPVDIKVVRNTADNGTTKLANTTNWQSFTSIIDAKLAYPNSALVGLRLGSNQFQSIPQRKYLIRGIKVAIPSNATVDTTTHLGRITYSGVWDGTFAAATWTNDPAWCLWDLLTNDRYGAGIPESSLDRYDFFAISQYCNTLVDDGKGGQEPRFSCNLLINQRREVYNVIQEMSSIFRGISYYGAGSLVLLQDKPSDAQYTLGPANVVDGVFSYSGSSVRSRHTCATVAYQNYDDLGEVSFEYVEDADGVAKYGVNNKDIKAVGCYSQGQANRLGKWTLLSEQDLYETCNFAIGIDSGIVVRPGMVVDIADPLRGGSRRNGRVSSATTLQITIDSTTELSVNMDKSPTISVVLPNGLVETRGINSISGTAVNVSTAFSQAPAVNAPWLIQTTDIQSQQFRVISVAENGDGVFGVSALKYNESIYNAVEQDLDLTQRDISNLTEPPPAVSNLSATEFLYEEGGSVRTGVDLNWASPLNVADFVVRYRLNDNNFERITTESPSTQVKGLKSGTLEVQITPRSLIGKTGPITRQTFALQGKTEPPSDVQNLSVETINANSARLRWDQAVDLDVKVGGRVIIRHSSLTGGTATWPNSVNLIPAVAGNSTEAIIPLVEGEILVKFEDDLGKRSINATSVLVDFPDTLGRLLVQEQREDQGIAPFSGTRTDVFYSSAFDGLVLDSDADFDSEASVDDISDIDGMGLIVPSGEYEFASTLDLGGVFSLDLTRRFVTRAFFPSGTIDQRQANIDSWNDFDGAGADAVNAKLYVRKTNDDPSGSPTYSVWQPFVSGTFIARAFQFKAELTSDDVSQSIVVDELGYLATFQRRQENSNSAIASGVATKSVTFDKAFFTGTAALGGTNAYLPSVGVTVQDLGAGERVNISSVSGTGFDLDVLDSGGSNVSRNFTYSAVGYGKKQ